MILERVEHIQVILCSDYMKGVLTDRVLNQTFTAARMRGIPAIVAPKDSNPRRYLGANVLMPNARELAQLMGTPVVGGDWLEKSARKLIGDLGLQALVVTRGAEGMSLFERTGNSVCRVDIATTARSVYDVTGAGDTAIAAVAAAVASGLSFKDAVRLANLAAGIKVGKRGTACVTANELLESVGQDLMNQAGLMYETYSSFVDKADTLSMQSVFEAGAGQLPKA